MNLSPDTLAGLPRVDAVLNYLKPMAEKPRSFAYALPQGVPQTNTRHEARTVPIHDARSIADFLALDDQGFQLVDTEARCATSTTTRR